jgi:hypothetical protein
MKEIKNKDTRDSKDIKKRERKTTSSSSSKTTSTQRNIKDFICLDDDNTITISTSAKSDMNMTIDSKFSEYNENDDLIKCNISMFSDEPTSFEEIKSNKDLINYNLSMFSDD